MAQMCFCLLMTFFYFYKVSNCLKSNIRNTEGRCNIQQKTVADFFIVATKNIKDINKCIGEKIGVFKKNQQANICNNSH